MGKELLFSAERAAGYAMATSDELLGIKAPVISASAPLPRDVVKVPSTCRGRVGAAEKVSLRSILSGWALR